jgi:putative pantetheine hydrolase
MTAAPHPGPHGDLTDVAGIAVGHHQRRGRGWLTGTTVVLPPPGTVGGVDVRGGGPGTRETDCLDPTTLVQRVDAVVLSGGSAYGLDAASGVMAVLAERHVGHPVGARPEHVVPIVPAAVLFDLGGGAFTNRPDTSFGRAAAESASMRRVRQGTVGAGTGAHAGRLKGGIGSASVVLADGTTVAALVALNSGGSPVDPRTGELWGANRGLGDEFAGLRRPSAADLRAYLALPPLAPPLNTTLAVIVTDARLAKHECHRLAGAGHDGMARAIDPIHLYSDGDVSFALSTGARELPVDDGVSGQRIAAARFRQLGIVMAAAADCVARAVVHAVLAATTASTTTGRLVAYRDQFPSACTRLPSGR